MRVFLAGGTGAVGRPLTNALLSQGHDVGVLARSDDAAQQVRDAGAESVRGDALDEGALTAAVTIFGPDVVVNQLTALPRSLLNVRQALRGARLTNRLRSEAAPNLVRAAVAAGAKRIISQSISFAQQPGAAIRTESDPLYSNAPRAHRQVVEAVAACERAVQDAVIDGVVLRYGAFYGPGTYFAAGEAYPRMLSRRLLPVIGDGAGIWALLHIDDAVDATIRALTGPPGTYNISDDDPVTAAELLPWMARELGTKSPRHAPRWLFSQGPATILRYLIDEQPAVSSSAARQVLGWQPRHRSWRQELGPILTGS